MDVFLIVIIERSLGNLEIEKEHANTAAQILDEVTVKLLPIATVLLCYCIATAPQSGHALPTQVGSMYS